VDSITLDSHTIGPQAHSREIRSSKSTSKSDADWRRGVSVTPRPARSLPPCPSPHRASDSWTLPGHGPAWMVGSALGPLAGAAHASVWCLSGAARSGPTIPIPLPSVLPSRLGLSLSTPATGEGAARAGDAHGDGDGESFPSRAGFGPAPRRRSR
jgi:hypothetical protein